MSGASRNIYQTARKAAGLTQEAAAEQLAVSVESLRAYENGYRIPPNDVVARMVVCYDKQYLAYQHLQESNELMARVVPELEQRPMMETVVRLYNRMKRLDRQGGVEQLLEIAEDGQISADERDAFDGIVADLREIVRSGLELEVFCAEDGR